MLAEPRSATIEEIFEAAGALQRGHFLLKSGRHSDRYLEKFAVLQYPALAEEIGRRLAAALVERSPTLVVGPTTGGVLLAYETARHLSGQLGRGVRGVFAEPVARGARALRRGWPVAPDERVVLVDDILTTGASLAETVRAVQEAGVAPLAAAVIVDRSTAPVDVGCPINALGRIEIASWEADACPLCDAGEPLLKPGSS
ncbi:MAG TPA: orotate phosphoribosyltransferase [candidate division Zixibacteria bacterium]|nr:orotate phosphoribosyltransferase [candidate division Zixibacteria bacterium]